MAKLLEHVKTELQLGVVTCFLSFSRTVMDGLECGILWKRYLHITIFRRRSGMWGFGWVPPTKTKWVETSALYIGLHHHIEMHSSQTLFPPSLWFPWQYFTRLLLTRCVFPRILTSYFLSVSCAPLIRHHHAKKE